MKKIKSDTLAVLHTDDSRVFSYVQIGARMREDMENYSNISVRFDRGSKAAICGYPQTWAVWDCDENTQDAAYHITPEIEIALLDGIAAGIERQAKDPMFIDSCSPSYRKECIRKIRNTQRALKALVARKAG